jgi:ATP-dependent helicase/nuclease subunit A
MTLRDAEARAQIARETGTTLFVEAGAGTGKTTALVERIVALIAGGAEVGGIAAITFTEKAAAELMDRVRQRLERAAAGEGEYAGLDQAARTRCRAAIDELDGASFQTIHAFARKLLAAHPLQTGLPPEFDVLDETEEALDAREHVRRLLDAIEGEEPEVRRPLVMAYAMGLQPKHVRELALQFARDWDRLRAAELVAPGSEPSWAPPLLAALDEVDQSGQKQPFLDYLRELRGYAVRLQEAYTRYREAGSDEAERRLAEMVTLAGRAPTIYATRGTGRPLAGAKEEFPAWRQGIARWALASLLPRLRQFALDYAEERRRSGRMTFHDLLVLAVDLLRGDVGVREETHGRYPHLLIDEFQDTDPLQVELAALIAGGPGADGDWRATRVAQGRLFFVGDPKQSIYRFRRADIAVYLEARGAFDSVPAELATNFRCTGAIIDWVNQVCRPMFDGRPEQAPWIPLDARPDAPVGVPVRVIGEAVAAQADEVRGMEAGAIARGVLQSRAENWAQFERGTRFADITVLVPRRTGLPALERTLSEHRIPYRIESQSLLYGAEEIREMTNVLTAVDDPTDRIAIVAALRSPLFACTDRELADHVRAGGRWTYEEAAPPESPARVREALAELAGWHRDRWMTSPAGMMERIIGERHLLLAGVADRRPREAWRRYRILAEQARALTMRGAVMTLRQFIEWLQLQRDERVRVNEAIVPEPDEDAVRVMTIHAAKGLEFPVVFVMGLGAGRSRTADVQVRWPRGTVGGSPEVRCGGTDGLFATPGFEGVASEEEAHEEAEDARLFYVAVTRAARALAVSLYRPAERSDKSLAGRVETALDAAGVTGERFEPAAGESAPPAGVRAGSAGAVPSRAEWLGRREGLTRRLGAAPVIAATTVARVDEPAEEAASASEPWRKGRAGTSIGRAVHAVLQGIDLATGAGLEETARAQAEAEGMPDRAAEVARLARNALGSKAVRAAVAGGKYWREVYVGAEFEGVVVEGFVDLLYETEAGDLVIVDYKTDSLRTVAEVDSAMARYRLQGAAYAAATERAVGRPVRQMVFVFTEPQAERAIDDLEAAKVEAVAKARELVGAVPTPGPG